MRLAGTSCWLQPPGGPHSTRGEAHPPGDGTHRTSCFVRRGLALTVVSPAKATCHLEAEAFQEWLGWAQSRDGAFLHNTLRTPRQHNGCSATLLGLLQGQGVPVREGQGGFAPQNAFWRQRMSQPAPWGLSRTLYLSCALNWDECCCWALGACQ